MTKNNEQIELFKEAMQGVEPLSKKHAIKIHSKIKPGKKIKGFNNSTSIKEKKSQPTNFFEDLESIDPESILSYQSSGLTKAQFNKLKKGTIIYQSRLDLHQLTCEVAERYILKFIEHNSIDELSCCLIIHGKGQGRIKSLTNQVLRNHFNVKGFHSAKAIHGGAGAVYVLLKINRI